MARFHNTVPRESHVFLVVQIAEYFVARCLVEISKLRTCRRLLGCSLVGFCCFYFFSKCLYVCWLAGFWMSVFRSFFPNNCDSGVDSDIVGAPKCHLANLLLTFWHIGVPFWRPGITMTPCSLESDFDRFGNDFGTPF